jgi:sterol 3beta-glucosyltransferase
MTLLARRSTEESLASDSDLGFEQSQPPLSQLFQDAALYNRVLHDDNESVLDLNVRGLEGNESVLSFAELVGRDLDEGEKTASSRFAQLASSGWLSDGDAEAVESPVSYGDAGSATESHSAPSTPRSGQRSHIADSGYGTASVHEKEELEDRSLTPNEIVNLLVDEFGSLADDGEEEQLVTEGDGGFLQDVTILVRD